MTASLFYIIIFAVAFAFVEAAVVVYLRHLLGSTQPNVSSDQILVLLPGIAFLEPETAIKIIKNSQLLAVERIREAATLITLTVVALLAATTVKRRIAYFLLAFGIWDIFYYLFLALTIGWPKTPTDLDVFFLLPTPWVGPVFVPIVISLSFIAASLWYLQKESKNE